MEKIGAGYRLWALRNHAKEFLMVSTTLSVFGCLVIIATYALYKDIRSSSRHIIVCISIADLVVSLSNLAADFLPPAIHDACILQSFVSSTALLASFMWTLFLAIFLYISLVLEKPFTARALIHPWFHLVCWLLPLVINMVALCTRNLGNNNDLAVSGWCWIEIPESDTVDIKRVILWMFLDGKGLEIITYLIILLIYIRIKIHLRKQIRHFERKQSFYTGAMTSLSLDAVRTIDQKLVLIPICYIMLRIWGTIRFLMYVLGKEQHGSLPFLMIMQAIGDNLVGFCNCIFFCFLTPKVRNHIKQSKLCTLHFKKKETETHHPVSERTNLI
ncbi:G-protein coupled receptor 157-like isoform X1 [Clytia hemisphaerica]|uniref:G-protein coupled receptors family 2 profile 2 domain-containing protein n=1 Tax=Clytia hemisphaerica TaxID=252671 RepID=A0A7M5V429_9CNID